MYSMMKKIAEARKQLELADQQKVEYVRMAYNDYISEYAKMDDELNVIGHPEQCKNEWLAGAVECEIIEESEFNRLFELMNVVGIEDAMSVA